MEMPAEHKEFIDRRRWHKVRWARNPHTDRAEWKDIEGRFDLMMEEDYQIYKPFVQVLETVSTPKCTTGLGLRFGVTPEAAIDKWIKENKQP